MNDWRYPPGWDAHRVRQLLELVPAVLELIAKHRLE
jgi:hypothetical protein